MKITWAVAVLASSVTAVNAQQTPRPLPAPKSPVPATAPTPAPAPRAGRPEPVLFPDIDWLLDAPSAMTMIAPGQNITPFPPLPSMAPLPMELPMLAPLPGQLSLGIDVPMAIDFPMPAPGQWMIEPPMAPLAPLAPPQPLEPMTPPAPLTPLAPSAPSAPFLWDFPQGQGPTTPRPPRPVRDVQVEQLLRELDRAEAAQRRELDQQIRAQDREAQRALEQTLRELAMQDRQNERIAQQVIREQEMQQRIQSREMEQHIRAAQAEVAHSVEALRSHNDMRVTAPAPWAPQDVADSAYQAARELFNRGEWGQAAQAFRTLPTRYPNSAYAPEAAYYQAFSLYRIGGTQDLRDALAALEASRTKYPNAKSRTEATNLTTRIRGVLAQRGDQQAAAELARTANERALPATARSRRSRPRR